MAPYRSNGWSCCHADASDVLCRQEISRLGSIKVYAYEEFLALGKTHPAPPVPPAAEDFCTIMYTSGTTGDPKVHEGPVASSVRHPMHFCRGRDFGQGCLDSHAVELSCRRFAASATNVCELPAANDRLCADI